ncbi:MAG: DUF2764 family protein [Candidatus Riflebacteria bacterium]|nr:DUF2764 family protein [Candidatus Riflebacteria bacterium]
MAAGLHYLLTFLPPLPGLGEAPPITLEEVGRLAGEIPGREIRALFELIQLEDTLRDLVGSRLHLPGVAGQPAPDPGSLPPTLAAMFGEAAADQTEEVWLTEVMDRFYRHVAERGRSLGSPLLTLWAGWERALRWQMAATRARNLAEEAPVPSGGGQPGGSFCQGPVAPPPDQGLDPAIDHTALIQEACMAQDPLAAELVLDEGRARFLEEQAVRYSFRIEELIAYILKLRLLLRHARLNRAEGIKILQEVTSV